MKKHDPTQPLIFIHIPKTAGTSTRKVVEQWYGEGFLPHYYSEAQGKMPVRHDIFALHRVERPIVVYGHFNRVRNFGIEDYYPEVQQFVTLLRDPLETALSSYFFMRKHASSWQDPGRVPAMPLPEYLATKKSVILNHFPRVVSKDNYKDIIEAFFIEIGITEQLDLSLQKIAGKLGFPYDSASVGYLNQTGRDQEVDESMRSRFMEDNELEFMVYNHVKNEVFRR